MKPRFLHIILFLLIAGSQQLMAHITVLTWNTERMGGYKKPEKNKVLQYLMTQDADVICLQEVDVYKNDEFLTLPDVKRMLSNKYPYSYIDFSIYNSRHQFGTMVWAKYPLINKQSIHYESRGNLSNRCDMVVGTDTIRIINNHLESYNFKPEDVAELDSLPNYRGLRAVFKRLKAKWDRAIPLRNNQARIVRKEIDDSPYPVIVVGDFNSPALSYAYHHIAKNLHDAWNDTHYFWEWGTTCEKRGWSLRIDYILCSNPLQPVQCTVPDAPGSDHKPVVATLTTKH